jgi:peptidoglycan/LPS O-acetylase OafA/YrhL
VENKGKLNADIVNVPEILAKAHLPSLDGLRAVSILIVIIAHINIYYKFDFLTDAVIGELGVYVFFVISGFLITTLLIKESIKTGTVSLKRFYIRRFLRIIPVAYLYLLVLIIGIKFFGLPAGYFSVLGSALFLRNLSIGVFPWNAFVNHYWSLSVEEQFYLMFPSVIKKRLSKSIYIVLGFLIVIIGIKIAEPNVSALHNSKFRIIFEFFSKLDGITIGCLCSLLLFKKIIQIRRKPKFLLLKKVLVGAAIYYIHGNFLDIPFGLNTILSSCFIAAFIILNLFESKDIIYTILNSRLFIHVGILSYSLYIWQELYIGILQEKYIQLRQNDEYLSLSLIPLYLALIYFTALCSYYLYEKRFLKLKDRFQSKARRTKLVMEQEVTN